jgi:acyl-CoA thioesterase I
MRIGVLASLLPLLLLAGCAEGGSEYPGLEEGALSRPEMVLVEGMEGPFPSSAAEGEGEVRAVFLGTSLTEGAGLPVPETQAWPARLGELAESAGLSVHVVNAGLSGETSAGAVRRLDWILSERPDVLVIETGANDGLRGLPIAELHANLNALIARARELHPGIEIALVSMEAPPNLGPVYVEEFRSVFEEVAAARETTLIRFLLDGVAGIPELNQADGIHPTPEGHRIMAQNAWEALEPLIRSARAP